MKNWADSSVKKNHINLLFPGLSSRFTAHLLTYLYHSFAPCYLLPSLSFQFTSPLLFISPSSFLSHLWDFRFCFLRIGRRKLISFPVGVPTEFSGILVIQICMSEQRAHESPVQQNVLSLIDDEYKSACCCHRQYRLLILRAVYIVEWRLWLNSSSLSPLCSLWIEFAIEIERKDKIKLLIMGMASALINDDKSERVKNISKSHSHIKLLHIRVYCWKPVTLSLPPRQ